MAYADPARDKIAPYLPGIREVFEPDTLKHICEMAEIEFADEYDMQEVEIAERTTNNYFLYKDHGSRVLAVAHLDTVVWPSERFTALVDTEAGWVVHSGALDDRLGAYIILELLPKLGIQYDILLTVGEESGQSTAEFFQPPEGKEYDWIIEFDRGGTDVVMYQYENTEVAGMVRATGARVASGSFSDIAYLEHLGVKAFNWGTGYKDYHQVRGYAFLEDTFKMVAHYMIFHETWEGTYMIHYPKPWGGKRKGTRYGGGSEYGGTAYVLGNPPVGGGGVGPSYGRAGAWEDDVPLGTSAVGSAVKDEDAMDFTTGVVDLDALMEKYPNLTPEEFEALFEFDTVTADPEVVDPPDYIENPTPEQVNKALALIEGGVIRDDVDEYLAAVSRFESDAPDPEPQG